MSKEAMKLALEALMRSRKAVSGDLDLAGCAYGSNDPDGHRYDNAKKALVTLDKAITALREALTEQPAQQEPVGSLSVRYHRGCKSMTNTDFDYNGDLPEGDYELYTTQPQRKPLTDEQIESINVRLAGSRDLARLFARAIEAAHGIGEKKLA